MKRNGKKMSRTSNIESDNSQTGGLDDYNYISDGIFPHPCIRKKTTFKKSKKKQLLLLASWVKSGSYMATVPKNLVKKKFVAKNLVPKNLSQNICPKIQTKWSQKNLPQKIQSQKSWSQKNWPPKNLSHKNWSQKIWSPKNWPQKNLS